MHVTQTLWDGPDRATGGEPVAAPDPSVQLALAFGGPAAVGDERVMRRVRAAYPNAHLFGCSTAGEVAGRQVSDDGLVVTACRFDHSTVRAAEVRLADVGGDSEAAGRRLAAALAGPGVRHVLLLSDGLAVNGSRLVAGLTAGLPPGVGLTGGLAADGPRFARTAVCAGDARAAESGVVAAVALVGDRLRVGTGSVGGWDPFGPERVVTRSAGNVLYELDGTPALALYKRYLGEHAAGLPATGLLFPLTIWPDPADADRPGAARADADPAGQPDALVRTVLSVDEATGSLTFAGDVPTGHRCRLMRGNFDHLVDGAQEAARAAGAGFAAGVGVAARPTALALLISCVGRKLLLGQRVEEEVEAVADALPGMALAGFYSYGEVAPARPGVAPALHNQTMTITTIAEA